MKDHRKISAKEKNPQKVTIQAQTIQLMWRTLLCFSTLTQIQKQTQMPMMWVTVYYIVRLIFFIAPINYLIFLSILFYFTYSTKVYTQTYLSNLWLLCLFKLTNLFPSSFNFAQFFISILFSILDILSDLI